MNDLNRAIAAIEEHPPKRIAVLTGAGISAESGVPTFRGAGGLWENHRAEDLATPQAFARDPELVWRWYEWRRALIREARPNAAHEALARLEQQLPPGSVAIVTQNVDGLHPLAGSSEIVEIHGNIFRVRCMREGTVSERREAFDAVPPRCSCGALLRPDVVWFGEMLPPGAWERAVDIVRETDLLLVVGTSGLVYPAAGLAAHLRRGVSIEINPALGGGGSGCDIPLALTACEAVPPIADAIARVAR